MAVGEAEGVFESLAAEDGVRAVEFVEVDFSGGGLVAVAVVEMGDPAAGLATECRVLGVLQELREPLLRFAVGLGAEGELGFDQRNLFAITGGKASVGAHGVEERLKGFPVDGIAGLIVEFVSGAELVEGGISNGNGGHAGEGGGGIGAVKPAEVLRALGERQPEVAVEIFAKGLVEAAGCGQGEAGKEEEGAAEEEVHCGSRVKRAGWAETTRPR